MPACTIVQIACASGNGKFWSVEGDGSLTLGSQAQLFVCHNKQGVECVVQHLQSGAFVEQGPDRSLRLCFDSASATVFAKLRAYSQANSPKEEQVWLRASSGGLVCPVDGKLAVTVNATRDDDPAHWCSFTFDAVDTDGLLVQESSHVLAHCQSDKLSHKVRYPKSETAAVSIGAKPMSSFAVHRSSALPIALKRPIRKVSFSDLSDLESNMSGIKSVPQLSSNMLRSSSSASPRSYTLRDAVFNRVPESPACSQHSEMAESEDSKVRGGHLYESDCSSSFASLNSHADTTGDIDATSSASTHHTSQASPPEPVSAAEAQPSSSDAAVCWSDMKKLNLCSVPTHTDVGSPPDNPGVSGKQQSSPTSSISTDELSCSGHKTHGGNLFGSAGQSDMRSTKSSSALYAPTRGPPNLQRHSLPLSYRSTHCHKTHGSNNALNALASSPDPSSLHISTPKAPSPSNHHIPTCSPGSLYCSDSEADSDSVLQFPSSSAPLPSWGILDDSPMASNPWYRGSAQSAARQPHSMQSGHSSSSQGPGSSESAQQDMNGDTHGSPISLLGSKWPFKRQTQDATLASPRCSGEYQREPSMPCILEGGPTPSHPVRGEAPLKSRSVNIQELLSRVEQAQKIHRPPGVKRIASSPVLPECFGSPAIHKVIPRGSPGFPSPPKRLQMGSQANLGTPNQAPVRA